MAQLSAMRSSSTWPVHVKLLFGLRCRISEDEFAMLLPQSDSRGARSVIKRSAAKFELAIQRLSSDLDHSLEFGIATFPFDGETTSQLLHTAFSIRQAHIACALRPT